MAILESDISVVIPTYRYRDKVVRAVESALASGAYEIIVVDDRSQDGTMERLAAYSDPRLRVHENERNLGLWENHLHALGKATRPWIKFIQADDYLLPGGLAAYAAAAADGVTVVCGIPIVKDDETGETWQFHNITRPRRLTPYEIQIACLYGGWILGSPSQTLLRANAIERDPHAWHKRISADLVVGFIAAARGDSVLLPSGAICSASHPQQDTHKQGTRLSLERSVRSLSYLRARPEPGLRRLANLWTILNLWFSLKTSARGLLLREVSLAAVLTTTAGLFNSFTLDDWWDIYRSRDDLRAAARFRRRTRRPLDLDKLLDIVLPVRAQPIRNAVVKT